MKKFWVACYVVFGVVNNANAGLIQWDAFSSGDELAVKDEETGLVWLDLSVTVGQHFDSVQELLSGWEFASTQAVEALLISAFSNIQFSGELGEPKKFEQRCANSSSCYESAKMWQRLFGAISGTRVYQTHSYGFYKDSSNILRMGGSYLNGSGSANRYGVDFTENYDLNYDQKYQQGDYAYYGAFLVKTDSKPVPISARVINTSITTDTSVVSEPKGAIIFTALCSILLLIRRRIAG